MEQETVESLLNFLRSNHWMVASHNDYRQNGRLMTFWLFTNHRLGRFVKGEGLTDLEALKECKLQADTWG